MTSLANERKIEYDKHEKNGSKGERDCCKA